MLFTHHRAAVGLCTHPADLSYPVLSAPRGTRCVCWCAWSRCLSLPTCTPHYPHSVWPLPPTTAPLLWEMPLVESSYGTTSPRLLTSGPALQQQQQQQVQEQEQQLLVVVVAVARQTSCHRARLFTGTPALLVLCASAWMGRTCCLAVRRECW